MKPLVVILYTAITILAADDVEIQVRHVRPSLLVARMAPVVNELGGVEANDLKGTLKIYGSEEEIAQLKRFVEMFDVRPQTVDIKWSVISDIDKVKISGMAGVPNNVVFTVEDSTTRIKVGITPRINSDASILSSIRVESDGGVFRGTFRTKSGVQFVAKLSDLEPSNDLAKQRLTWDARSLPRFEFTSTIRSK